MRPCIRPWGTRFLMACARLGCQSDALTSAFDAVDGSPTGISLRHIAVALEQRRESAFGTLPTLAGYRVQVRSPVHCRRSAPNVGSPPHGGPGSEER
jgi:hypothetical protein